MVGDRVSGWTHGCGEGDAEASVPARRRTRPQGLRSAAPTIEAYKRTVSRAGRWVWQQFDQAYSNGFAHGKPGGNVAESGIAGVQRQGKITPDTGYVGTATFNLLHRSSSRPGCPTPASMR